MAGPSITIIIPVYNVATPIARLIVNDDA